MCDRTFRSCRVRCIIVLFVSLPCIISLTNPFPDGQSHQSHVSSPPWRVRCPFVIDSGRIPPPPRLPFHPTIAFFLPVALGLVHSQLSGPVPEGYMVSASGYPVVCSFLYIMGQVTDRSSSLYCPGSSSPPISFLRVLLFAS